MFTTRQESPMSPARTAGPMVDRRDLSSSIAAHLYELPEVHEIRMKSPDDAHERQRARVRHSLLVCRRGDLATDRRRL
jgi:hypothetical protein